jgi:hypothetical protein
VDGGAGITPSANATVTSATQASIVLRIDAAAVLGPRNLTVKSLAGTSNPVSFTVNPIFAVLTAISPNHLGQGSTIDVTLTGTGFNSPMTVNAGDGITASNVVVTSSTLAKATLAISADAAAGVRDLTVTTTANTSNPQSLTVLAPFPDLLISDTRAPRFGVGFNENFGIVVSNAGSVPTSGPTTVTYDFSTVTFVSADGTGWACALTSATRVTCTFSGEFAAGAQSTINVTVAVGNVSATQATGTFAVSAASDLNTTNNSIADQVPIVKLPEFTFSSSLGSPYLPGSQKSVILDAFPPTFPHPLTGSILLAFEPGIAVPIDDPAIQFSTGGRQVDFVIPADSKVMLFAGDSSLAFQTGTVAGTITLSAAIHSEGTVQPHAIPSKILTTPGSGPKIMNVSVDKQSGLVFSITMFSNTRELTTISFGFRVPGFSMKLSCGAVTNCSVSGSAIIFNLQSLAENWYAGDVLNGGIATLRFPFALDQSLSGLLDIVIANSKAPSETITVPFP